MNLADTAALVALALVLAIAPAARAESTPVIVVPETESAPPEPERETTTIYVLPPAPQPVYVVPAPPAPPRVTMGTRPSARHAVYIEGTTLILMNSAGVDYSYRPLRGLAISAGIGVGAVNGLIVSAHGYGGQLMVHGLFGAGPDRSFELAFGGAFLRSEGSFVFDEDGDETDVERMFYPSFFAGYRRHPLDGGFLARAGAAWSFGFGIGFSGSLGVAF